jgi:hypothetical protein
VNAAEQQRLYEQEAGRDALARETHAAALLKAPKCRSCQKPLRWIVTNRGRRMPVDFYPHEDGNIVVHPDGRADVYQGTPSTIPDGTTLHFSHFATCPNADAHRRTR